MPFLSSKPTINKDSGALRFLLTASLSIAFVLLSPVFVLLAPFIFAKRVTDELMSKPSVKKQINEEAIELPPLKWNISDDSFNIWKNTGK